jgi:putative hydrolase of the HAD superfamily
VIFDWGGTLTPWLSMDQAAAWRAYLAELYSEDQAERVEELVAGLLAAEDAAWLRVRDDHRAFTVAQVLAAAGVASDEAALLAYRTFWEPATLTHPDVVPVLGALRERGLRIGLLSSTAWPRDWHEDVLRRDGAFELFDACVWSSDLEWTKPHPEAFRAAMSAVGVDDPADCVFVGDRPFDDISGAKAVGMRAVLVPHSDIPLHEQVPVTVTPDAVINRLTDLLPLVDRWAAG